MCNFLCIIVRIWCYTLFMSFNPWDRYPPLTQERLELTADLIRVARRETVLLHDTAAGDNAWSLGCRVYARSCFAIRNAARTYDWLKVVAELDGLSFTFAIGGVPLRFFRGDPDDPPSRYLAISFGELRQLQLNLDDGVSTDRLIRIAVETIVTGEASDITLVEMDEAGNVTDTYLIAQQGRMSQVSGNVVPLQTRPVELPPVTLEPNDEAADNTRMERDAS